MRERRQRAYSDHDIAAALAVVSQHGGNITAASKQLDMPRRTLSLWYNQARIATQAEKASHDYASLWAEGQRAFLSEAVKKAKEGKTQLRDLVIAAGIAADKHLDYSEGRKGSGVNVNANQAIVVFDV